MEALLLLPVLVEAASRTPGAARECSSRTRVEGLALIRAARSELLCRCRRFTATASSTPLARGAFAARCFPQLLTQPSAS